MASLAENVHKLHQSSIAFKDKAKESLSNYSKDINKTVIGEIQNAKVSLVGQ